MPDLSDFNDIFKEVEFRKQEQEISENKEIQAKVIYAKEIISDPKYNLFLGEIQDRIVKAKEDRDGLVDIMINNHEMTTEQILALKNKITYVTAWVDCMESTICFIDDILNEGTKLDKLFDGSKLNAVLNGAVS